MVKTPPPYFKSYHSPLPISPPLTPRQIPGSPSLLLYKSFEIFCQNMTRIIFIKFFKP